MFLVLVLAVIAVADALYVVVVVLVVVVSCLCGCGRAPNGRSPLFRISETQRPCTNDEAKIALRTRIFQKPLIEVGSLKAFGRSGYIASVQQSQPPRSCLRHASSVVSSLSQREDFKRFFVSVFGHYKSLSFAFRGGWRMELVLFRASDSPS